MKFIPSGRGSVIGLLALLLGMAIAHRVTSRMDGPWGMIPGGPFVTSEPDLPCGGQSPIHSVDLGELEVEVHASDPRTITTWNVVLDGSLYLPADFLTPIKRWPQQVVEDPLVRVRAAGQVYRCAAVRVTEADRVEALREAIAEKYAIDPDGWASRATVWWFELRPVTGSESRTPSSVSYKTP